MNGLAKIGWQLLLMMQAFGIAALAFLLWKGKIPFEPLEAIVSAGFFLALIFLYRPASRGSRAAMLICLAMCSIYLALFAVSASVDGLPNKALPLLGPLGATANVIGLAWTLLVHRPLR
jgi:hypothetical protein